MSVREFSAAALASALALCLFGGGASAQVLSPRAFSTSASLINEAKGFNYTSSAIRSNTLGQGGLGISGNLNLSGGPSSKPFSNVAPRPTVSPYLGLFNEGFGELSIADETDNYFNIVRPQLQQQQLNNRFRQQVGQINRQIQTQNRALQNQSVVQEQQLNAQFQQAVGQAAFNPRGSDRVMPTGHSTTFGFTGRFYPGRR